MSSSSDSFHKDLVQEKGIDDATGFSRDGQLIRFGVLAKRCIRSQPILGSSVLDYGCNVGDLLDYVWNIGWRVNYTGVDVLPEFLRRLQEKHGEKGAAVVLGSIMDDAPFGLLKQRGPYDYVFASGAFCYADQLRDHLTMLQRLWELTSNTMAVNFLSDRIATERRTSKLIHCLYNPNFGSYLAGALGCKLFTVFHDYRENDFTVALYRA